MTEDEAEAMQARSDLLNDRVQARLAREGAENYARILQEEIKRLNREHPAPPPTPEQRAERAAWLEAFNRGAGEARAAPDPEEGEPGHGHPVAERAQELFYRWQEQADTEGWVPETAVAEHPVRELLGAMGKAHVKLAAWLNDREWPPKRDFCAITIVRLKKVREYLDDALRALESCEEEALLGPAQAGPMAAEVLGLARDVDELIAELRRRRERGTE